MLDDVERGRFLVEPPGEDALELVLRVADVDLDERAGQLLDFPRRGRFAGAQPHDHVAGAQRLAGLHGQIARNAVALVEQADHRHPVAHRRRPRRDRGHGLRNVDRLRLVDRFDLGLFLRLGHVAVAAGEREQSTENKHRASHCGAGPEAASPIVGSAAGGGSPPERLMNEPIMPIMSIEPCVSKIVSPSLSLVSAPPGISAI